MEFLKLNNGITMPQFGLGCGGIYRKRDLFSQDSIRLFNVYCKAIKGEEKIFYDSEAVGLHENLLGYAIKVKNNRKNMFICTKLSNPQQRAGDVKAAFYRSLKRLHIEYIDLYLMHWPQPGRFIESWKQMEEIYQMGGAKAIGVCNFHKHHLDELMKCASIKPMVNQFEIHPLFTQKDLIQYCVNMDIVPMAYTPLGRMHDVLINSMILKQIARKYQKTVPQIIVRWDIQQGIAVIPKTTKYYRLKEYLECFNFTLTDEEMNQIDSLNDNVRLRYNPDKCDFNAL